MVERTRASYKKQWRRYAMLSCGTLQATCGCLPSRPEHTPMFHIRHARTEEKEGEGAAKTRIAMAARAWFTATSVCRVLPPLVLSPREANKTPAGRTRGVPSASRLVPPRTGPPRLLVVRAHFFQFRDEVLHVLRIRLSLKRLLTRRSHLGFFII